MFNIFKNLKQLKELNDMLSKEIVVVEKEGVKVKINGKMEVEEIILNQNLDIVKQQKILKECLNEALRKLQMSLVNKMSSIY